MAAEGLLWAVFWWAWNGAMFWKISPQVRHLYSRRAPRFLCTCCSWRCRSDLRWKVLSHLEHWCFFIFKWDSSWRFKASNRVKTFPQVPHSFLDFLTSGRSASSYKTINKRISISINSTIFKVQSIIPQLVVFCRLHSVNRFQEAVQYPENRNKICEFCKVIE